MSSGIYLNAEKKRGLCEVRIKKPLSNTGETLLIILPYATIQEWLV
jgi:hypothetical protein